ncbi:unnamed protein product [Lactuca saligna]|nr:unnamed protein product [Lactuca saligna]
MVKKSQPPGRTFQPPSPNFLSFSNRWKLQSTHIYSRSRCCQFFFSSYVRRRLLPIVSEFISRLAAIGVGITRHCVGCCFLWVLCPLRKSEVEDGAAIAVSCYSQVVGSSERHILAITTAPLLPNIQQRRNAATTDVGAAAAASSCHHHHCMPPSSQNSRRIATTTALRWWLPPSPTTGDHKVAVVQGIQNYSWSRETMYKTVGRTIVVAMKVELSHWLFHLDDYMFQEKTPALHSYFLLSRCTSIHELPIKILYVSLFCSQ